MMKSSSKEFDPDSNDKQFSQNAATSNNAPVSEDQIKIDEDLAA